MYLYENKCIPTIKPVSVALNTNDLVITLPNLTLLNGKKWYLLLCQYLPQGTEVGNVSFVVDGTTYPAVNGIGNALKTDMLCSRKRHTLVYGWDAPHFMLCGTKPSSFVPTPTTGA